MRLLAVAGLVAGLLLTTILVTAEGVGAIWRSASLLGLAGFAIVTACHLVLMAWMGLAWWFLVRGRRPPAPFIWGRMVRDSASEVLPFSQIGGYVLGARAATLAGVPGPLAAASTVVDVTVELLAQLAYTGLGLWLLQRLRPDDGLGLPLLLALCAMALLAACFLGLQARGAGWAERSAGRLARWLLGRDPGGGDSIRAGIKRIHARWGAMLLAAATHLTAWALNGFETWLTLRLMGIALSIESALVVDSLLFGLRSMAFLVPSAFGVQEGALVVLGGLFGIGPDAAIALSLVKRARDLVIGVPVLLLWQTLEGRRAWTRDVLATGSRPGH